MLDDSNNYFDDGEPEREVMMPRRANDAFAMIDGPELPMLFDSFWQPAELALLFGHPGVGKSLLAVQIAEAIARGNRILGEGACGDTAATRPLCRPGDELSAVCREVRTVRVRAGVLSRHAAV